MNNCEINTEVIGENIEKLPAYWFWKNGISDNLIDLLLEEIK